MSRGGIWAAQRSATLRACGIAGAVVAAALALPPLLGSFYYGLDLTRIDLGLLCAIKERLVHQGSLELSPLLGNGGALLARPDSQLFYPPRWIALLFSPDAGIAFEVVLHLSIAAASTAWLARTFGVRTFTAAAAGIAFALSGTVIDLLRHAHYMVAAAWLPLVWAGVREMLRRRGGRLPLLAVFGGLLACLLGAEPQSFAVATAVVGVELARRLFAHRRPHRRSLEAVACVLAAGLVGLIQWAPTLGELALSRRAGNLGSADALEWSMTSPGWLGVLLPGMPTAYVRPVTSLWQVLSGSLWTPTPWNPTPYLGCLLVVAAIAGLGVQRARPAAVIACGAAVFAAGDQLPVLPLLMKVLPQLTRFRYPAKYWLIASLALSIVAAVVADGLSRRRAWRRRVAFGAAAVAGCLVLLAGWVWLNERPINLLAEQMRSRPVGLYLPTLSAALLTSTAQALSVIGAGLLLLWSTRWRRYLYGLVVLDAVAALPYALLIGPGLANVDAAQPLFPVAAPASAVVCVQPSLSGRFFPYTEQSIPWNQALFGRLHLVPEQQACAGVRSGYDYSPLQTTISQSLDSGLRRSSASVMRAFGCTHFVAEAPFVPDVPLSEHPIEFRLPQFLGEETTRVDTSMFELPEPLAEAFISRAPEMVGDEREVASRVEAAIGRAALLRIVDDPLGRLTSPTLPAGDGAGSLTLDRRETTKAVVRVLGAGGAVVGLRTPFLVGWTAVQAGQALPVVRIAGNQLGAVVAEVSAGPIEFRYRAPNFASGLTAASGGLLMFGVVFARRRRSPRAR